MMVEVTEEAAAELMEWLCEYDKGCDCDHCNDLRTHTLPLVTKDLANIYQRGKLEGARLAIEAAAKDAEEWFPAGTASRYPAIGVVGSIRALDLAKIVDLAQPRALG